MKKGLLIVAVIVGIFLLTRKASASSPSSLTYPQGVRPTGPVPDYGAVHAMNRADVEAGWNDARMQIDEDFRGGATLYEDHQGNFDAYPYPIPPRVVAVVMWRESHGTDATSTIGEKGYMQLTTAEIETAGGGDPHNMGDSIRMSQILYQKTIERHPQDNPEDELFVALLSRSIGVGALRWLLSRIPEGDTRLTDRVEDWLQATPERPVGIHQTDRKFTLRIARALMRANRADGDGFIAAEGHLTALA